MGVVEHCWAAFHFEERVFVVDLYGARGNVCLSSKERYHLVRSSI